MTAPTRLPQPTSKTAVPSVGADATMEATANLALPRPSMMDRLHFARAGAADVQRTLGNRVAERMAQEKQAAGELPPDGTAPKRDANARDPDRPLQPHADEPTAPRIAAPSTRPQAEVPDVPAKGIAAPAPAPPPAMGVPAVQPPPPGPARTVADLQAQVGRAAAAIPKPASGTFTAAQQAIRAQGFRLASAHGAPAATKKSGGGGGRAREEHPDRPHEPDPVPTETKALDDAGKKKLDEIKKFPPFTETPLHHLPKLGTRPLSESDVQRLTVAARDADNKKRLADDDKKRLEERAAAREKEAINIKDPAKKKAFLEAKVQEGEPKTFAEMQALLERQPTPEEVKAKAEKKTTDKKVDDAVPKYDEPEPPGPIVFGEAKKGQMGKVLAGLLAEPDVTAEQILHLIRPHVVSKVPLGPTLEEVFPNIGQWQKPKIVLALQAQVKNLQQGANIADADLQKLVDERKAELAKMRADAQAGSTAAQVAAAREVREKGKEEAAAAAAKKEAADAKHGLVKKAAPKIKLPMDVDARRARLLGYVAKDVAEMAVKLKQKGEIRDLMVAKMARDQLDAYKLAAQQDEYSINTTAKDAKSKETGAALEGVRDWLAKATKTVEDFKAAQKVIDDANVAKLQTDVRTKGDAKSKAIRAWADKTSGKKRSEQQVAADQAIDAAERKKAEDAAIEQLSKSRVAMGVSNDFGIVDQIAEEVKKGHDKETIAASLHLNGVQRAILDAYMNPPVPGDDRALSGVMAGVRARVQMELTPTIGPEIEKEILVWHNDDEEGLSRIGAVQTPGFNAAERANQAHTALDKLDTDEEGVYKALDSLTKIQARALRLAYIRQWDTTIESDMDGVVYGLSGSELKRAQKLLEGNQAAADAIGYRIALKGNEGAWYHTGLGSGDSEALDKINHGKSKEERQAAEDAYNQENDPALKAQLENVTDEKEREAIVKRYRASGKSQLLEDAKASLATDRQKERFTASVAGDDDTADALELRDLLPTPATIREVQTQTQGSEMGDMSELVVADRKKVEALYDRIRAEAKARGEREHWTSAEIEAEIARRTDKIEKIFNAKFAKDYEGKEGESALRTAFDIGFRHQPDEKNLANALADNDTARIDAAKIHIEHRGIYADDDVENAVLESQYKRALEERRHDEMPIRKLAMARELRDKEKEARDKARAAVLARDPKATEEADRAAARAWTGAKEWEERERLQRQIDRTLETAAAKQAAGNMNALRDAYQNDYKEKLDDVVRSDTSGYSGRKAETLLAQNGQLTLGQTMFYAVRGSGTDEAALDSLKGHTKAEIDEARKEFKTLAEADNQTGLGKWNRLWGRWDNTDMDQEIADDVSGRTGFDVSQMLKGEPETVNEKRERLKEAVDWEKQAGPMGRLLGETQEKALEYDLARLDKTIDKLNDPTLTAEQREIYLGFFEQDVETVNAGIKAHREALDTWTERITTVVGIVVGLAVTIVTFGAAGPVMAAVLGSIMATAATMALKAQILGAAYGWEDITTDIVVGIVDAVTAALTAGMGDKLLGTAEKAAVPAAKSGLGKAVQAALRKGGTFAVLNPAESALSKAIPTSTLLKEMVERGGLSKLLAKGFAEGLEVLVAATPSALASTLLDENTYKEGNVLGNIASGTMKQAGMSLGMAMGLKVGMHAGHPVREFGGRIFEAFRAPEAPALHDFKLAQREYPGITHEEFSKMRAAAELEIRERQRATAENSTHAEEPRQESARDATSDSASGDRATDRQALPDKPVPEANVGESRPSEAGIPAPNDPNVLKGPDFTTPRELTEANVRELVPKSLQDKVKVVVDPKLEAGTVKVERVMRLGIVVDVKLVVGPHVRPIDVIMHGRTVKQMQRYLGVTGRVVSAIERMRSLIVRDGLPPFGSKAWESYHELQKLPRIIDQRLEMLRTGSLDPHAEAQIHADIESLSRQVDEHRAKLALMDKSPGEGFIAMKGTDPAHLEPRPERKYSRSERGDPSLERFPAEHSALKSKYPKAEFVMVDRPWIETKADGSQRTYRTLEVRDPKTGEVLVRREEIRSLDASGRETDHWVQRGSEANVTGEIGETAFALQREATGAPANEKLLPSEMIQREGGQGFDGVIVRFDEHGATIVLIEVKNYPDRYVPLHDITAIKENLNKNLEHLEKLLSNAESREKLGLTKDQAKAALLAIEKNRLEFEVHVGEKTGLGNIGDPRSSVLAELRREIATQRKMDVEDVTVRKGTIKEEFLRAAKEQVEAKLKLKEEVQALARAGGSTTTELGVRRAEAALTAQGKVPGLAERPFQVTKSPNTFLDAKNHPVTVFTPERGANSVKLAGEVVKTLRAANAAGGNPARMIVDVSLLSADGQRTLRRNLQMLANQAPKLNLQNVVIVDSSRGITARFTALPK